MPDEDDEPVALGRPGRGGSGAPASATLLLVEDEDGVRELIHEWLAAHDYVVHSAEDGHQALQVAEGIEQVDLLIADVVMPTMGGPALAKRLLQSRPDLKVIFVSGYADEAIGDRRMLEDGASFLQKPFTLEELLKKVRAGAGRSRVLAERLARRVEQPGRADVGLARSTRRRDRGSRTPASSSTASPSGWQPKP